MCAQSKGPSLLLDGTQMTVGRAKCQYAGAAPLRTPALAP